MSKAKKKMLVPKQRFPEFRDAVEWEETTLGKSVTFLDGQRKPIKESDRATMQGEYPYYGASGVIDYVNDFIFDENLILLGEDGENIVSRNLPLVFKVTGKCWVNNHAHVLTPKKPHHLDFLVQYMESLSYIKYNSGGAQPKLNQAVCKKIPLILPKALEQQKIAGCLSSIDALIIAHNQKLDALKAHKKGLMQQLFPAAGETVPKLRFPEFRDAGEWEEKTLGSLCFNISSGKDKSNSDGIFDLYGSTGVIGKTLRNSYEGSYILVARVGANAGLLTMAVGKFSVTDNTLVVDLKESSQIEFIFYQLYNFGLNSLVFGSGQPLITGKQLKEFNLLQPNPAEQQKIADCLSSIDKLITAQAQKIAALKAHKKGLMQQLFPSTDEVGA